MDDYIHWCQSLPRFPRRNIANTESTAEKKVVNMTKISLAMHEVCLEPEKEWGRKKKRCICIFPFSIQDIFSWWKMDADTQSSSPCWCWCKKRAGWMLPIKPVLQSHWKMYCRKKKKCIRFLSSPSVVFLTLKNHKLKFFESKKTSSLALITLPKRAKCE